MRRLLAVSVVAALVGVMSCSADESDASNDSGAATRTVEHVEGSTEIPDEPQRVVTLWASTLSAMASLGEQPVGYAFNDKPALGVDVPEDYDLDALDYLGSAQELELERIAATNPDLIIATEAHVDYYDQLSDIAPTVVLEWTGTSAWKQHLRDVAEVLQLEGEADRVEADYEAHVDRVAEAIGDPGSIDVSVVRFHASELRLEVRNSFAGQVVDDVGLSRPEVQDVEEDESGYVAVSLEQLPDADGDALFAFTIANADDSVEDDLLRSARESPLWEQLSVVRNDRVHEVDYMTWISSNYVGAHAILDDLESALG